ncbi:helix-turn-helix domain-containing protein [Trichormus azollae]|uniref:helix-turn-helix domain-containing protein n=1 Tax=Trichormus azollae TaxID=1164 RepID=UPI00325F27B7
MQHKKLQGEIESKKIPINQKRGGRKLKLEIKEQVCLSLFSLRKMPTFEILGLHFGISKREVKDTFHYWLEILGDVLPASLLEQVEKHDSDYGSPTQKKRQKTKSFPARVFLLKTSLNL